MSLVILVVAFAVSAVGPGVVVCRRLAWRPLEKWCAAVGVSLFIQFLIGFGVAVSGADVRWHYLAGVVGVVGTMVGAGEIRRLLRAREVRTALVSYAVVLGVAVIMICSIRNLGGGEWFGDWVEHYQRTGFWLGKFPLDYKFIGAYALTARPPMMNVLCANLIAQACQPGPYPFAVYQVGLLLLGSLVVLPVGLIVRAVWPGRGKRTGVAVALLLMNPMFVQNLTYPWTRHLTTFFVLTGMGLYLAGWRKRERSRVVGAFVLLTVGMLVHYSTGPWLLFMVMHYLIAVWPRRVGRWREVGVIVGSCAAVLLVWVGWAVWTYGAGVTFGANSVITDSSHYSAGGNVGKIVGNMVRTIVPIFLRGTPETIQQQTSGWGFARDYAFVTYQQNIILALGSVGLVLVVRAWRKVWGMRGERGFWVALVAFVGVVGIAVNGTPDWYGYAHIVLQPMVYIGVCLVAASVAGVWRWVLLGGVVVDFWLGIFLHLSLENWTGENVLALGPAAVSNMQMKLQGGMLLVGDRVGEAGGVLLGVIVVGWLAGMVWVGRRLRGDS